MRGDYMISAKFDKGNIYISGVSEFDLPHTLDCGQAFRWEETENGRWKGIAYGKYLELEKLSDGTVILYDTSEEDFNNIWRRYFDLDRDYEKIIEITEVITHEKISWRKALPVPHAGADDLHLWGRRHGGRDEHGLGRHLRGKHGGLKHRRRA